MQAWAALCYVPLPGWQVVPVYACPKSRLVRYHAWQGGMTSLLLWLVLVAAAWGRRVAALEQALDVGAGLLVLMVLGFMLRAAFAAAKGGFARVPGAWHLLRACRL